MLQNSGAISSSSETQTMERWRHAGAMGDIIVPNIIQDIIQDNVLHIIYDNILNI